MTAPRPAPESISDAILDRLQTLYPQLIDLSLGRVERLLGQLGNPQEHLPPCVHVAGTNGKGSVCAFLRAIGEQAGWPVHVTTSPHLVRLRERFRVAGTLVSDAALADVLGEIERVNAGAPITVFEALAAAGFVLFSRNPARLCVVEVGLGGRFDATNVLPKPAACAIASISRDHEDFLGSDLARIAWEKAGIMKAGRPVATGTQMPEVAAMLRSCAREAGAILLEHGQDFEVEARPDGLIFRDALGQLALPPPSLLGAHQVENAGIAIAALRAAGLGVPDSAFGGIGRATWPARLQRLHGLLAASLPQDFELWLDGGHNEGAGRALAAQLEAWHDRPTYLLVGMKLGKDASGFLAPLLPRAAAVWAVAEPGQHLAAPVADIVAASGGVASPGPRLADALAACGRLEPGRVLICGSLYLAGEALKADGAEPS